VGTVGTAGTVGEEREERGKGCQVEEKTKEK